jgi:hypothetical protein
MYLHVVYGCRLALPVCGKFHCQQPDFVHLEFRIQYRNLLIATLRQKKADKAVMLRQEQ